MSEMPRVWIGCIGCYNGGFLVGEWVDADEAGTYAAMDEWVNLIDSAGMWPNGRAQTYHIVEAHEELWCYDTEGFGDMIKGECSPSHAAEVWELLEDLSDDDRAAFAAWLENHNMSPDFDALKSFRDAFRGRWDSEGDYARDWAEEVDGVKTSEWPYNCIDWEEAAEELLSGDHYSASAPGGGVFMFCG